MPAMNPAIGQLQDLSRDPSFSAAVVSLDTSKWTGRRRNIVLRALRDGITKCGYETARFIEILTTGYGATVQILSKWSGGLDLMAVKPEEVDNLIAYTSSWVKLHLSNQRSEQRNYWHYWNPGWHIRRFIEEVEAGKIPRRIPLPSNLTDRQQVEFIKQYLKDDDSTLDARESLARAIENGETLTLRVNAI